MPVISNIGTLATCKDAGSQADTHSIPDAALAWDGENILWLGPEKDLPLQYRTFEKINAGGRLLVPGLIDCHTHLAFAGWRADEFEMRMQGRSYLDIARAGGGILSTVEKTRRASEDELYQRCLEFLTGMSALGVTTVECKSGYGLDTENELKLLRVYKRLKETQVVGIVPTFLGAHTIAPEYRSNRAGYVRLIIEQMLPKVAAEKLAVFCDVFVEDSAFTQDEAAVILKAAAAYGLFPRAHVDQLSASGGAEFAAAAGAVSADHLEMSSEQGLIALAASGTVAVILPLASVCTAQPALDARRLLRAGVRVAVATDFNPGSAPSYHLPLAMFLSCVLCRLRPSEALKAATINAARALKIEEKAGSLEPGKRADFALIDSPDINHWLYHFRANACLLTVASGRIVHQSADLGN